MLDYMTKFMNDISNNTNNNDTMTTAATSLPTSATRTTTATTTAATIKQSLQSKVLLSATAARPSATLSSSSAAAATRTTPTFNDNIKRLFNKTLDHVANSNLGDYTAQYSSLPPLSGGSISSSGSSSLNVTATLPTGATGGSSHHHHLHLETSTFPVQTVATFIAGNKSRATTIVVYPTDYRSSRAISLRPERSLSQGFTSIELDTVLEERCSDVEQTTTEIINADSPLETSPNFKLTFPS